MSTKNLGNDITKLIELQKIDQAIYNLKSELDIFPEEIKKLDDEINRKTDIFKASEDKVKQLQLKKKEKEMELGTKEESIKKLQNQLFSLKTNQEYSAMQREIESQKADKSVLEEDILNIMYGIEQADKELADNKNIFQKEKSIVDTKKKEMENKKQSMQEELKNTEGGRKAHTEGIDKDVLSRYERILKVREGNAIVPIEGDACGGCNMNLPPQVVNEARLMADLVTCGNCSRILYFNG